MANPIPWYQSTILLYCLAITAWGSTWYAIKLQIGVVAPEVSVVYRFVIASFTLFITCLILRKSFRFNFGQHLNFMTQGLCMYSLTYIMAYHAGARIPSGLNAVLFSTIVLFNVLNTAIFFGQRISMLSILGSLMGLSGLVLIFLPEIMEVTLDVSELIGMGFSILGGYIGSIGNMYSVKAQDSGIKVLQSNTFSMAYGAIFAAIISVFLGKSFTFDSSTTYIASLFYLAIIGSIVTFGSFLTVLGRLGPERASYPMVLIPVVAMGFSVILEDFEWPMLASAGILMMIFGNCIVTMRPLFQNYLKRMRGDPSKKNINQI